MDTTMHHYLIELSQVDESYLNDTDHIETALLDSVKNSDATYLNHTIHKFEPHGVTGMVAIAESHVSVHTWPEHGFLAFDVCTCGKKEIALQVVQNFIKSFGTCWVKEQHIIRGNDERFIDEPFLYESQWEYNENQLSLF
jgi:S-adenosylmethionine decarboxylase